jgi:hypothetical protein
MANLLEQAIECNDGDHAAKIIQHALGIESDDVANYVFPKTWPIDREQRARILGSGCRPRRASWPDASDRPCRRRGPSGSGSGLFGQNCRA